MTSPLTHTHTRTHTQVFKVRESAVAASRELRLPAPVGALQERGGGGALHVSQQLQLGKEDVQIERRARLHLGLGRSHLPRPIAASRGQRGRRGAQGSCLSCAHEPRGRHEAHAWSL